MSGWSCASDQMGSNAFDCPLRNSEEELCRSGQELNKRFEQTGSVDISAMVDSDEQFEAGPLQETQKRETISGNKAGDLQGKQKQETNSGLQPSVQDIFESKKLNATSFPQQGLSVCFFQKYFGGSSFFDLRFTLSRFLLVFTFFLLLSTIF